MLSKVVADAKSELFILAVDAFWSGSAYNQWVFGTGLLEDVQLDMHYAGEDTFWTGLKGFTEVMVGRQAVEKQKLTMPKEMWPLGAVKVSSLQATNSVKSTRTTIGKRT